ncbi:MAG: glycosyltransferase family 4 protein [Hyphomicrobiaceae bacterium]
MLLTVSGTIPATLSAEIAQQLRPRADYLELARSMKADLIDYARAREVAGRTGTILERIGGPNLVLAYACWLLRGRYQAIVTDGEQVGLPLAALLKLASKRRPRHVMITHIISTSKKTFLVDYLKLSTCIDRFVVYCRWQGDYIQNRWKLAPDRVVHTHFMVDERFFAPGKAPGSVRCKDFPRPQICAVGLERRDYPTLIQAVDGLDVDVIIAAASPWSRQKDNTSGQSIPPNVTVRRFSQFELRQLYADCEFMVMPLQPVDFQAGITAILEAMAMAKAVICSKTPGQTDVIVEGETGRYVAAGDPTAMRSEIARLLAHPEEAARLGANARDLVVHEMSLDRYAERLSKIVREACGASLAPG